MCDFVYCAFFSDHLLRMKTGPFVSVSSGEFSGVSRLIRKMHLENNELKHPMKSIFVKFCAWSCENKVVRVLPTLLTVSLARL